MSAWIRSVTGRAHQFRPHSSIHRAGRVLSARLLVKVRLGTPLRKLQQPNSKLQINPKLQISNGQPRTAVNKASANHAIWALEIGIWSFFGIWILGFGAFNESLWCSPANMPASHAGDHRSEAGQGRQSRLEYWSGGLLDCWAKSRALRGAATPRLHHSSTPFRDSFAGSSNSRTSPFEGDYVGANPSPAAIFGVE